jgi:hypothetical protein
MQFFENRAEKKSFGKESGPAGNLQGLISISLQLLADPHIDR